jgi:chromosome partitioning protein
MSAVSIVLLNQKGGVGKTSTTHHLAGTLARMGKRVLLVDNDPQASLTQGFYGPVETRQIPAELTVAACYAGANPFATDLIRPTPVAGVDLIPGSRHAALHNVPAPHTQDYERRHCLAELVRGVEEAYDLIFFDCPPNLHLCSWAAMVSSNGLIVPLQPEDYGAQGLLDIQESVNLVLATDNPSLATIGFLITMNHARKTLHRQYEETLRTVYGSAVFATMIPNSIDFPEAIANRKPISEYKPKGAAAKAMRALADELLERLAATPCNTQGEAA